MNRRRFLTITAVSLFGIVGIGSIVQKSGRTKKSVSVDVLNSKFRGVGFSIKCGLAATQGRLADKIGEVPLKRMEFGQILVDGIFLSESEFNSFIMK